MENLSTNNVKKYIEHYNLEEYLFKEVGKNARKRGHLTFREFYDICMWKSARQKNRYIKNKTIVEKVTKEAFSEKDELKKIKSLCTLDGVWIPTASAILTIVYPDKYAVIDIRCLEELIKQKYQISKNINEKIWLQYLQIMRTESSKLNITPRELDMALFAMHRERLNNENFRNLYK